jgi:phosphoribosylformylglycinamidine (FGAM) synthase-like amidotransferase family enzyme
MSKPVVNVLFAPGTNSHKETMWMFERAGARAELLLLRDVLNGNAQLDSGDALCIPGGFAFGDHLGAGALEGKYLQLRLAEQLERARQKPMIAICNGFQVAVRSGLFGSDIALDVNESGTFRNIVRQPHIIEQSTNNVWLQGLEGRTIYFSCAHGEGRLTGKKTEHWEPAIRYPEGQNPDGSMDNIGGISSPDGLLLGLMDHPERLPDEPGTLEIFQNGVRAAASVSA